MKVVVYPADQFGCGYHRLIWPAGVLRSQGHDVTIVNTDERRVPMVMDGDEVVDVRLPDGCDVAVFQRATHRYLLGTIKVLRRKGVAVVVDVDDDLSAIHPDNPAFERMHPRNLGRIDRRTGKVHQHSWQHLADACREATLVTVSTPALLARYAAHGRGRVLHNYLAEHHYRVEHQDSDVIGWPASLHSHPNDPDVVGPAVARLVGEGADFRVVGEPLRCGAAFKLPADPPGQPVNLMNYPAAIAELGIAVTPLADTRFNAAKSWLKPLELSAAGVPWVGSPRAEYARLHGYGCGVLANRPKDWYRELRNLRQSESARQELSEAGRAVAATLRLEDHAWRYAEAWGDALTIQREMSPAMARE